MRYLVVDPLTVETRLSRATRVAPTGTSTARSAICWAWLTNRLDSAAVALEALRAVREALWRSLGVRLRRRAVRLAFAFVAVAVRLAFAFVAVAVRSAFAFVAVADVRVAFRLRVAAAF